MVRPQFVDLSSWNPLQIAWRTYVKWAKQWDGIARVALRSTFGLRLDSHFARYKYRASQSGCDSITCYHYAYPQVSGPLAQANWQAREIGPLRPLDKIMLDMEEDVVEANGDWAYRYLDQQQRNYPNNEIILYASSAYILQKLQDARLSRFTLWLANWQFFPQETPTSPPPWTNYGYLQWTDKAMIPGIDTPVDCNVVVN